MTRIDVICPVYREAAGIDAFHDRLARALSGIDGVAFGILYVLDPSPDASEVRLRAIAARDPRVRVLVMLRRFGHQAALLAGLEASRAEAAITMDADGQHPPEAIREFVTRHRAGADVVHGVRGRSAYAPWGERIAACRPSRQVSIRSARVSGSAKPHWARLCASALTGIATGTCAGLAGASDRVAVAALKPYGSRVRANARRLSE